MTAPQTCKHCNGTTFCGATTTANGVVKKRVACVSCVVRSGLQHNVVYDRVVCSVCGGTGIVQSEGGKRKTQTPLWAVLGTPLMLGTIIALLVSLILSRYELARYKEMVEQLRLQALGPPGTTRSADFKARITPGMSSDTLREMVGAPDSMKQLGGGLAELELWYYNCIDGRVMVTIRDGKVEGVKQ